MAIETLFWLSFIPTALVLYRGFWVSRKVALAKELCSRFDRIHYSIYKRYRLGGYWRATRRTPASLFWALDSWSVDALFPLMEKHGENLLQASAKKAFGQPY